MTDSLASLHALLASDPAAVPARLRAAVATRRGERGVHFEWARLCELAGEPRLALTEYQLALRDVPESAEILTRLAVLYEEHGELEHAVECAARAWQVAPAESTFDAYLDLLAATQAFETARAVIGEASARGLDPDATSGAARRLAEAERPHAPDEPDPISPGSGEADPTDADAVRFAHLFAGRENIYARQWCSESGEVGYSPVRDPFTVREARNHLLGTITAGIYLVRLDNTVTLFAVDIDITKRAIAAARGSVPEARRLKGLAAAEALRLHRELAGLGLPALLEDSGYKGRHLWIFLAEPEAASVVRQLGALLLARVPLQTRDLHAEFFPKQASAGAGVGNLIKLPLGIHRKSGRRSRILRPDGTPDPEPFATLRRHPRIARDSLHAAITALRQTPAVTVVGPAETSASEEEAPPGCPALLPAPPAAPPAWTAADFETSREVAHLMRHCPVLDALKRQVEQHRRLTHDERLVLVHTVGHTGEGVLAVNYLLDACVDTPPGTKLQSPLAGHPMSCPKIRKRIPRVTGSVPCHCSFHFAPEHYPTPRLHLLTLPATSEPPGAVRPRPAPAWDAADRARALGVLWATRDRLAGEIAALEGELVQWLSAAATGEIDTGDGTLRLVQEAGAPPALEWVPCAHAGRAGEGTASGSTTPAQGERRGPGEGTSAGAR